MENKKLTTTQQELLKKPLPSEAISQHPTKAYLSTIKAIYVVERLNDVFGVGGWIVNNEVVTTNGKMVVVKSSFCAPEYNIRIVDIFGGNDNADLGDAYKGACTDALTKIGSYLGIGMDVYKGLATNHKTPLRPVKDIPISAVQPFNTVPLEKQFIEEPIEKIKACKNKAELTNLYNAMPASQQLVDHILIAFKNKVETFKTK